MPDAVRSLFSKKRVFSSINCRHHKLVRTSLALAVFWLFLFGMRLRAQTCSVAIPLNPPSPVAGQPVAFTAKVQNVPPVDNDNASVTLDSQPLCATTGNQGLQCSSTVSSLSAG